MKKHRKLLIAAGLLAVVASAAALWLFHEIVRPPEAARLLPEGDVLIYATLRPLHLLLSSKQADLHPAPEYQDFITQTGIQPERDLNEVAVSRQDTPDGRDTESSEVFVGHFDSARLGAWLEKISTGKEQYMGKTIFSFPHDGHSIRVCQLRSDTIAVTNMASASPMHRIIDRQQAPGGPLLLESYYRHVPAGSVGWLMARIPAKGPGLPIPGGLNINLHQDAVAVASMRYTGTLTTRVDLLTQSESEAKELASSIRPVVAVARDVGLPKPNDQDIKAAFDSIRIEQKESTVTITVTVPEKLLKKLANDAQSDTDKR
ncbi:MAG TPA: hypothetical protein VFK06_24400 [Candidatus Angelobacter sp.]|nr:hypothetical protein [Candidatus Angelobacter sp.]